MIYAYQNDKLHLDRRSFEVLDNTNVVSASMSWTGQLTTDDRVSVKQMLDYHEDIEGNLVAKQFSKITCDQFVFFVNELTANSY